VGWVRMILFLQWNRSKVACLSSAQAERLTAMKRPLSREEIRMKNICTG